MNVDVVGDEALIVALDRLASDLHVAGPLLDDVAVHVARDARTLAPKRTGRLAASISVVHFTRGHVVRTSMPYAQYVHYGSIHNPRPRPFLDMAARRVEAQVNGIVDNGVDAAIGRAGL